MKVYLVATLLCALSACSAPSSSSQDLDFVPVARDVSSGNHPAYKSPSRAPVSSSLPFVSEQSRQFTNTGRGVSKSSAALKAFRAGGTFWTQPEFEPITLGKFRLQMRQVRYDNHDFIVVAHASNIIGARRFNLTAKTLQVAQSKTTCSVNGDVYKVRDGAIGMVMPLTC